MLLKASGKPGSLPAWGPGEQIAYQPFSRSCACPTRSLFLSCGNFLTQSRKAHCEPLMSSSKAVVPSLLRQNGYQFFLKGCAPACRILSGYRNNFTPCTSDSCAVKTAKPKRLFSLLLLCTNWQMLSSLDSSCGRPKIGSPKFSNPRNL